MNETTTQIKTKSPNPQHIIAYRVQNLMAVELFECEPKGEHLIILGGPNGAGKSTALNAIWYVLGGKPNLPDPLPNGTKSIHDQIGNWINWETTECRAEIQTEELKMERRWWLDPKTKEVETEVRVYDSSGDDFDPKLRRYRSGGEQELLNSLLTQIGFDFSLFLRKNDPDQLREFKTLFPEVDTASLEREEAQLVEDRKDAKKEVDRIQGRNAGMKLDRELPETEESVTLLSVELTEATGFNQTGLDLARDILAAEQGLEQSPVWVQSKERQIAQIEEQLKQAKQELSDHLIKRDRAKVALQAKRTELVNFKPKDVDALTKRIEAIGETNAKIRENNRIREALAEFKQAEETRAGLERAVLDCRKRQKDLVQAALKQAKFAVDGVEIREGLIWFQDVPLKQQNTEKQFRFCAAVAVKRNPVMPVFRLGDGEKITPPNMKLLLAIAVEHGAQVFVEMAQTQEMTDLAKKNPETLIVPTLLMREGRSYPV